MGIRTSGHNCEASSGMAQQLVTSAALRKFVCGLTRSSIRTELGHPSPARRRRVSFLRGNRNHDQPRSGSPTMATCRRFQSTRTGQDIDDPGRILTSAGPDGGAGIRFARSLNHAWCCPRISVHRRPELRHLWARSIPEKFAGPSRARSCVSGEATLPDSNRSSHRMPNSTQLALDSTLRRARSSSCNNVI